MISFNHFLVFCIVQNTVSSSYFSIEHWNYPDASKSENSDETTDYEPWIYPDASKSENSDETTDYEHWIYLDASKSENSDETTDYAIFIELQPWMYPDASKSENSDETTDYEHWIYPDASKSENRDETTNYGITDSVYSNEYFGHDCVEKDRSLISHNDIKYLIEQKAEVFKIEENLVSSFYPEAEKIFKKYMEELEEFQEQLEDRPEHMLHILYDMADSRKKLEPDVQEIAAQLQEFHSVEYNYNDVAESSLVMLNQLDKYKKICSISCENYDIENRFGHEIIILDPSIVSKSADKYCVRLKDLNEYINVKLSQEQMHYDLYRELEIRDSEYAQKLSEFKINLKEAAVKRFGMTMYDILSLQDDYHHFVKYLKNVNISFEIHNIEENTAETKLRLLGLKRNIEKYRQYCMNCNINRRAKRDIFDLHDSSVYVVEDSDIPIENRIDAWSDIVDKLIKAMIIEIKETIISNFSNMFEELDEDINDPDVIDLYVRKLQPIQDEIEEDIKTEQEILYHLKTRIPEASIDKILALSKESKQMIQSLESAKQFIDIFISRYSE